jgi:hypothetical protein
LFMMEAHPVRFEIRLAGYHLVAALRLSRSAAALPG